MTAAQLAQQLGGPLENGSPYPGGPELKGAAPLESATPTDLAFTANEKSFEAARNSHAGCLIAPPSFVSATGQSVIRADAPRALFARGVALLYPPRALRPGVHASSVVESDVTIDESAEIGPLCFIDAGTTIGPFTRLGAGCRVGRSVTIGSHCIMHSGVVLYDFTVIGNRAIVHSGAVIGADGFGFAPQDGKWVKFPQVGHVVIGDDVEIGANTCIDRAALGVTRIGSGAKLDNMVHIGHNCEIGRHVVIAAQTGLSGGVTVGDGAIIGGQVGVGDKARIEAGVVLGSGSGVLPSKIVRAGQPLWGTPARPLREYLEQLALFARLPEFRKEMKTLRERLIALEKAALEIVD